MSKRIAHIALVVDDYDVAIDFYTNKLDFRLVEDTPVSEDKRWVIVAPGDANGCSLLLAKASNAEQEKAVGNQSGGRVFLFLFTDAFQADYEKYGMRGIEFVRPPQRFDYGIVAVFKDLYGNLWDLVGPAENNSEL